MDYVKLNTGNMMPQIGYGVYQTVPEETERCVRKAIEADCRSIDTAQTYANAEGMGKTIANCGLAREELFVTTYDPKTVEWLVSLA